MLERMQESGQVVPALQNRPKLDPWLNWGVIQFYDLSNDRSYTDSGYPLPIQLSSIRLFFDSFHYGRHLAFESFYDLIRLIDRIWINRRVSKLNSDAKAAASKKAR